MTPKDPPNATSGNTIQPVTSQAHSDITLAIGTKYQAALMSNEIDGLLRVLFSTKMPFSEAVDKIVSGKTKTLLTEGMTKAHISFSDDPQRIHSYLEDVKKTLAHMHVVRLKVAIRPTQHAVEVFSDWIKHTVGTDVLIDFSYEPSVIAGAVIEYKGKVKDYTVSQAIDDFFAKHTY